MLERLDDVRAAALAVAQPVSPGTDAHFEAHSSYTWRCVAANATASS